METGSKSAYAITSQTNSTSRIIPTVTITAPDNSADPYADTREDPNTQYNAGVQIVEQSEVSQEAKPISNLQEDTHAEINVNTPVTSFFILNKFRIQSYQQILN